MITMIGPVTRTRIVNDARNYAGRFDHPLTEANISETANWAAAQYFELPIVQTYEIVIEALKA